MIESIEDIYNRLSIAANAIKSVASGHEGLSRRIEEVNQARIDKIQKHSMRLHDIDLKIEELEKKLNEMSCANKTKEDKQ